MILAEEVSDIFEKVTPPPGVFNTNPAAGLGQLLTFALQLFLAVTALTLLFFLLWGGFDWIMSGGDREKLEQAQQKITNAMLGLFIVIGALTIFIYITGTVFGIIKFNKGFEFKLPTLQDAPAAIPAQRGGPGQPLPR